MYLQTNNWDNFFFAYNDHHQPFPECDRNDNAINAQLTPENISYLLIIPRFQFPKLEIIFMGASRLIKKTMRTNFQLISTQVLRKNVFGY